MSEHKTVFWFADDAKPNTFFFRSPFRSWKFVLNSAILALLLLGCMSVLIQNWNVWTSQSRLIFAALILLQGVAAPYLRAFQKYQKVHQLHLEGALAAQPAGSPVDKVLAVADEAINEGLLFTQLNVGLLLLFGFLIQMR